MNKATRLVTGIAVGCIASLGALALAADKPAPPGPAAAPMQQDRAQMRKEMVQRHLDRVASRLEIKASQQPAWQAYADAIQAACAMDATPPAPDADAAAIARHRAERVATLGRKLSAVADATARLQGVLSADQKTVFNQITREMGWHHGMRGFGPPMMEHRWMERRGDDDARMDRGWRQRGWTEPLPPRSSSDDGDTND